LHFERCASPQLFVLPFNIRHSAFDIRHFAVGCHLPSAPRPFETWVVPATHQHRFEGSASREIGDLAQVLQGTVRRLHAVQPGVLLEMAIHTAPNPAMRLRDDEWRALGEDYPYDIEITLDGSAQEAVAGFAVNPVPPEATPK
jgi:UDPglucose--hexose-1-phosphate uridylyltransferase